jgi:hypothetical protein
MKCILDGFIIEAITNLLKWLYVDTAACHMTEYTSKEILLQPRPTKLTPLYMQ